MRCRASVPARAGVTMLCDAMARHNTFEAPNTVASAECEGAKPTDQGFSAAIPPTSVVALEIRR